MWGVLKYIFCFSVGCIKTYSIWVNWNILFRENVFEDHALFELTKNAHGKEFFITNSPSADNPRHILTLDLSVPLPDAPYHCES